jgi:prepilin-type N-terminal cleavage/methylation domain-containing protein
MKLKIKKIIFITNSKASGFTLIELLIVIAVIGILAAALLVMLDPMDRIKAGNDTKVIGDVRGISDAAVRYYTQKSILPVDINELISFGELKYTPKPPGFLGGIYGSSYGYETNSSTGSVVVWGIVHSKNYRSKASASGSDIAYFTIADNRSCFTITLPDQNFLCP